MLKSFLQVVIWIYKILNFVLENKLETVLQNI